MIQTNRYISRVHYKTLNHPTKNVVVIHANDYKTAKRIIEEKYNSNGKQLIEIKSLRILNNE